MTAAEVGVGCVGTREKITDGRTGALLYRQRQSPFLKGAGHGYDGRVNRALTSCKTTVSSSNWALDDTPSNALMAVTENCERWLG